MLQPVANVKTLLIEGSCSPVNCCHYGGIAERSLRQQLKSSMGDIMISTTVSKRISDMVASMKHSKAFKYRIFLFTDLSHRYIDMTGVL